MKTVINTLPSALIIHEIDRVGIIADLYAVIRHGISFNIPAKTIQILNDLEPTLQLLSKARQDSIKRYLTFRLHKYLGYIKHNRENDLHIEPTIDASEVIKEVEHT